MLRWNPWTDLARAEQDLLQFFDARTGKLSPLAQNGDAARPVTWTPAVDVYEDEKKIVLTADLPGVEDKDLAISVEKNVLTVKGERRAESPVEGKEGYRRLERVQGAFTRAFTLPQTVDAEHIAADLKAGVLTLTLPKKAEAQPRQIKVSVAS